MSDSPSHMPKRTDRHTVRPKGGANVPRKPTSERPHKQKRHRPVEGAVVETEGRDIIHTLDAECCMECGISALTPDKSNEGKQ